MEFLKLLLLTNSPPGTAIGLIPKIQAYIYSLPDFVARPQNFLRAVVTRQRVAKSCIEWNLQPFLSVSLSKGLRHGSSRGGA
jgi:hypothetical protein